MHDGNGVAHSPEGRQIDSVGPRSPYPDGHENAARPPTSRERTATRGDVSFIGNGRSPHSTLSQTGRGALQLPLGRHSSSDAPIKEFPLAQDN